MTAPLSPERETEIRERLGSTLAVRKSDTEALLAELDRVRAELADKPAKTLAMAADKLTLELTAEGATLPGYPSAIRSAVRNLRAMADEAATGGVA